MYHTRMYAVAALLVAAAALLLYDQAKKAPSFQPGDRVALFGDSLAQGLRPPLSGLASHSGVKMVADVQVGSRLDQWVTRGPAMAQGSRYALISLGTNDAVGNAQHRAKAPAYAKAISDALKANGVQPIWILPPPMKFPTEEIKDAIKATGDVTLESADYPRYDGIHPTPAGFQQWAADVWAEVGPRLGSTQPSSDELPAGDGSVKRGSAGPVEVRPRKVCFADKSFVEPGVPEIGVSQVYAVKVGSVQVGVPEVGPVELGSFEVGSAEVGLLEVASAEISAFQVSSTQVRTVEVGPLKHRPSQIRVVEVRSAKIGLGQNDPPELVPREDCAWLREDGDVGTIGVRHVSCREGGTCLFPLGNASDKKRCSFFDALSRDHHVDVSVPDGGTVVAIFSHCLLESLFPTQTHPGISSSFFPLTAPERSAPLRSACLRSAIIKLAYVSTAPFIFASLRSASRKLTSLSQALLRSHLGPTMVALEESKSKPNLPENASSATAPGTSSHSVHPVISHTLAGASNCFPGITT